MATRTTNLLMKSSLVCGMLLAASPLIADTWTDPATGITWTYTVTGGKASVGGGSLGNPAVPTSTQGAIVVPTAIGGKPVTEVGNSAFAFCSSLTDVTIPAAVTNIGDYAFLNCGALTNVVVLGALNSYGQSHFYDGVSAELATYVTAKWTGPTDMWQERAVKYLTHKVRFHSNGGTGTMADQGVVWYGTTNLTANAFVRDGSEFVGWATNLTGAVVYADGAAVSLADDIDLYAMWRLSPGQAAGGGALEFTTGGYSVWFGMVDNTASSGQSACSGALGNNQTNWLATTVSGTGRISFNWKVDCEAAGDYLAFRLDGASMDSISGTVNWTQMVYTVTSNADHTFLWLYSKNRSGKAGSDCGWVESVRWEPVPACTVTYEPGADGTGASQSDVGLQGESIVLRGVLFTREGYTQTGWATTEGGAQAYALGAEYDVGASLVLYPVWSADGFAMTETVNGVEWTFTVSNATACVGSDDSTAVPVSTRGAIAIPETLGGYPVTRIGDCAFMDCSRITGIVIPNSVTEVGEAAFVGCSALKSVTIPQCVCDDGLWYSFDADVITKVVIPDGVERIGDGAFAGCYNLVSVTIPSSVTAIGAYAFEGCSSLKRVAIPSGVESIGEGAFADCWELTAVTIPASVTSIADHAFDGCFSLGRVTIPQGVLSIGASAFADCCDLAGVTIPNSVTNIGEQAFIGCATLSSLTIPDSVTLIGEGAFYECSGLASVTVPITYFYNNGETQHVMQFAFDTTLYSDVVISERPENNYNSYYNESRIPDYAFSGFVNVTSVKLPDSVTEIGTQAFYGCSSLKNVNLPDATWTEWGGERTRGVRYIGSEAFLGCSSLTSVTIPGSVYDLGYDVFARCPAIKDLTLPINRLDFYWIFGDPWEDPNGNWRSLVYALETVTILGVWDSGYDNIPSHKFEGLPNLRSVVLPSSVRSIGEWAFADCPKLESVTIADGVRPQNHGEDWEIGSRAFYGCSSLKRVDIPEGVKYIRNEAFYGCTSLADVTLPDSVMYIENSAFWNCRSLKSVNFPEAVWSSEYDELRGGVRSIGSGAFSGCSSLTSAILPSSLESIGEYAFTDCYRLKEVVLPRCVFIEGLENVFRYFDPWYHGYDDYAVHVWEKVEVGYGVERVPDNAFEALPNLRTVVLPSSVRSIGNSAFRNCPKLESVTIADGVRPQNYNNDDCEIGSGAFWNCSSLKQVDIPEGVKYIRNEAFYGCTSLTDVTLPDSVMYIESQAFYGCHGLMNVTIPSGVAEIDTCAFAECSSLMSVKFMGNAPEMVDDSAFENVAENCTAYVLPDSTGWGVNAGETWKGLRLMYWYYAGFPLVENDADVIVAMAGSADGRLASMITNVVEYYAYWDWAHAVKNKVGEFVGTPEVKSSLHAAPAYLLGATELFDNEPTIEIVDVVMGRVESASASRPRLAGSSRSSAATMTVSVVVKDGGRAVAVDPAKVAAMFEATSDLNDWNGAAKLTPEVETLESDGATMRFRVTPGDGTAPSAFLRIRK